MINTTRLVKEIFEDIIETGGSTRMIDGTPAMLGYAVGGYATALQIKLDTPSDVIGEVSKWIDNTPLLTLDGYYVGAWIDSETNILWLDATRVHPPCSEAKRAAAMLGSQARGSDARKPSARQRRLANWRLRRRQQA